MSTPRPRLLALLKTQTVLFSQTYNPSGIRTGASVLRQRLRGPSMAAYYPRRVVTYKDLVRAYRGFDEDMRTWDEEEEDRLEGLAYAKMRGKGAPKKKRRAEDSKKMKGKKKPAVAAAAAAKV